MTTDPPNSRLAAFLLAEAGDCIAAGRPGHALQLLAKSYTLNPGGPAFRPLADACRLLGRWEQLASFCARQQRLQPDDPWPWFHLAAYHLQHQRFLAATVPLREALRRDPTLPEPWVELGNLWKRLGEVQRAIVCYRQALKAAPGCVAAQDNLLFSLLFSDRVTPEQIAQAHREWGRRWLGGGVPPQLLPGTRLRGGYLSPDLREHSVASFLEPLLRHHDRQRFEIVCYQCNQEEDAVTARLKGYADRWRSIAHLSDDAAEAIIRQDRLQLLVELAGHTADNRLRLLARRPAPLQVTWLGYPHATGLDAIGYRLSDAIADPPATADHLESERLLRLPPPFLCYQPPADSPEPGPPPAARTGQVTFGCFNRIDKASPATLALWRELLAQAPTAILALKSEVFADPAATERFITRSGLPADRLRLLERTPDRSSHLALYNRIDIALDTFPYNGTTTTCEALWMGVPVITLAGGHHAARVGKTLLEAVGLGDLVADTAEGYLHRAAALTQDLNGLTQLRQRLRATMESSLLCDAERFTRNMEDAYRSMMASLSA